MPVSHLDVALTLGDLCTVQADGICTSTNPHLALMIGTGGAVRDAGGWTIQEECAQLVAAEYARSGRRYFSVGSAHLTSAGTLPYRGVIHCVASDAFHETSVDVIALCVRNALELAEKERWESIAMPLFGTGHAAFDIALAAKAIAAGLSSSVTTSVRHVVIVTRSEVERAAMAAALDERR